MNTRITTIITFGLVLLIYFILMLILKIGTKPTSLDINKIFNVPLNNSKASKFFLKKTISKSPNFYELHNSSNSLPPRHHRSLQVRGRDLYYQGGKIYLVGVSRREALGRNWYGFGLKRYENEIIKYRLNYERIDVVRDYRKLRKHCQKMRNYGIIVELTLYDRDQGGFLADVNKVIEATGDLGNIIYEPVNELYSDEDVKIAKKLTRYLVRKGFLVSAGAYGAGGEKWSEKFDPIKSQNQIISVHRHWDKESILKYLSAGKPVVRNEYFDRGDLGLAGTMRIMIESFEAGAAGVNYYGFRMNALKDLPRLDPEPYWKYLKFVSQLSKKFQTKKLS